jgi:hypothetical protein
MSQKQQRKPKATKRPRFTLMEMLEARQLLSATLALDHSLMVFNAKNGVASPVETLTLTNTGDADLTVGAGGVTLVKDPSVVSDDHARWTIVNAASIPATISAGQSFVLQLKYTPSIVGRQSSLLDITTNDPVTPTAAVTLHGIGAAGLSGSGQPSLARILRAWNIPTIVGEGPNDSNEATDSIYPTPADPSSQEVSLQRLVKAGAGPVTINVLASFTANLPQPYTLGMYTPGNPNNLQELFHTPDSESQSVFVHPQGTTSFDPGSNPFGFYFVSNVQVKGRIGYSEDALNTWDTNVNRKFRFFPMENPDGSAVPNSYVMTTTEWNDPTGYDFTNLVAIVSNVMAAPSAPAGPALTVQDPNAVPGSNNVIFNRIQNPNVTLGDVVHDTDTLHLTNTGGSDLTINSFTLSSAWTLVNAPSFPLTIAAGAAMDLTLKFIATTEPAHPYGETDSSTTSNNGGVYNGTFTLNTNDPNTPTRNIPLAGWWQKDSESNDEPSLQSLVNLMLGWGTSINPTPIPVLTEGASTPTYYGEEVKSFYWTLADPAVQVTTKQLQSFHTQGNTAQFSWFTKSGTGALTTHTLYTTAADDGQTLFPLTGTGAATTAAFSPGSTTPFGFKEDAEWSDDAINVAKNGASGQTGGGHHFRFYAVRRADGTLVPNTYIVCMDYQGINFDFQDNVFVVTNIRPSGVLAAPMDLFAVPGNGSASLTWAPVAGTVQGYNIYRSLAPNSGFSLLTSGVGTTSYVDNTAPTGTTVYYRVNAVDSTTGLETLGSVAATTTLGTPVTGLQSVDINATPTGSTSIDTTDPNNSIYTIVAGGPGVTGNSDGFRYLFEQQLGDFDLRLQVNSVSVGGNFATAGLMARTSLDANSPDVYMSASPGSPGNAANYRFKSRTSAGATTSIATGGSVSFPNAWVRLRRVGNVFTGFYSTDGVNWTKLSQTTVSLGSTIYVGIAVASNVTTTTTTANVDHFGPSFTGPVANADSFNTTADQSASLNVLANDTDATGTIDPTTVVIVDAPNQGGTATFNTTTHLIDYTPAAGFSGIETFTYTVQDNNALTSSQATVTVIVAPTGPTANDDSFNAIAGQAVTVNVLANDTDPTGTIDPTTLKITTAPNNGGILSVDPVSGMITYTAASGFSGTETFQYTVADNMSLTSAPATVTFTVVAPSPTNPPIANPDSASAVAGQSTLINVLANDTDASGTIDPTTVAITTPPDQGGNVQIDPATGAINYTPALDFFGTETFAYTVADSNGKTSNPATVTITVTQPVAGPVAGDDTASGLTGTTITINELANDTAVAGISTGSVAITANPAHGTAIVNVDGTIAYRPAAGFIGRDTLSYTVNDTNGSTSNTATVTVSVGVAVAPGTVGANRILSWTDGDSTAATFILTRGTAQVFFTGTGSVSTRAGRATISGAVGDVSGITLTGTTAASSLILRGVGGDGLIKVGGVDGSGGSLGAMIAPAANLTGSINIAGLSVFQFGHIGAAQVHIGGGIATGPALLGGSVADSSIQSDASIRLLKVTSFTTAAGTSSTISAPSIGTLLSLGEFNASLGLTGAPAPAATLGVARVVGAVSGGTWNIAGRTGTIVAGSVAAGWSGNIEGALGAMTILSGGFASNLTAGSVGSIVVLGDFTGDLTTSNAAVLRVTGAMNGSTLTFTGPAGGGLSLNALVVGGAITNTTLTTAGDVGAIVGSSLIGSTLDIGTDAGVSFGSVTAANIGSHTLRSLRLTSHAAGAFADSTVIANTISSAVIGDVTTTNGGTPEGLAAHSLRTLSASIKGVNILAGPAQLSDTATFNAFASSKGIASLDDFDVDIV